MSNNLKDKHAGNRSGERTKLFEKKNANPNEVTKKQQTPNEEVPNIGDQEKKGPVVQPSRKPSEENDFEKNDKEISLSEVINEGKTELEVQQPEVQETK